MEIIAFASGKGGTGKTLMVSCLGYLLVQAGHRVLMVDADPATDGLSLFLLGPKGIHQISDFQPNNTFTGVLREFQNSKQVLFTPRKINRSGPDSHGGHGLTYEAIISGRGLYGDEADSLALAVPDLDQNTFQTGISAFFRSLRENVQYDYVLVDTRGGFAFESTDVCALADSFIVVTEPDFTSFYQDRNLVKRISAASQRLSSRPLLRSIIVNKATDLELGVERMDLRRVETSFRLELTKEFPLKFEDTHPVPVDVEALKAYKTQRIPYLAAPASIFSFATVSAFSDILHVVTALWTESQVNGWNAVVNSISQAVDNRNKQIIENQTLHAKKEEEIVNIRRENVLLRDRADQLEREVKRTDRLVLDEGTRSELRLKELSVASRKYRVIMASIISLLFSVVMLSVYMILKYKANAGVESRFQSEFQFSQPPFNVAAGRGVYNFGFTSQEIANVNENGTVQIKDLTVTVLIKPHSPHISCDIWVFLGPAPLGFQRGAVKQEEYPSPSDLRLPGSTQVRFVVGDGSNLISNNYRSFTIPLDHLTASYDFDRGQAEGFPTIQNLKGAFNPTMKLSRGLYAQILVWNGDQTVNFDVVEVSLNVSAVRINSQALSERSLP